MYLIHPGKKQFKANLHSHTLQTDGKLSVEAVIQAYRDNGYSILAITDHEYPKSHAEKSEKDFLMLTGYEAYIRPDPSFKSNIYAPEIHLNLFAKDPWNEAIVCFNESATKFLTPEEMAALQKVGPQRPREYTVEYINEFIRWAREAGYLVAYNHPVWSMESEDMILSYEGLFSLEMVNGGSWVTNCMEYNGPLYQKMLRSGKRIFVHGGDDNHNPRPFDHPRNDSFVAWTMIMADELEYGAVIDAMERGEMYSSMGPSFEEVSIEGDTVHVECSDVVAILCHQGCKAPDCVMAPPGETIRSADLKLRPGARFAQISIVDKDGHHADTRGFFRDELGLPPL